MNNPEQHADKSKEPDKFNFGKNCQLTEVFKRNNYFYGKLMTVSDFELEQRYINNKRHLINRFVHGTGIVCGLGISRISKISEKPEQQESSAERWCITITNGFALDCCGREIVFVNKEEIKDYFLNIEQYYPSVYKEYNESKLIGLYIRRVDREIDPILSPSTSSSCDTMECNSHIEEQYQIFPEVFAAIKLDKLSYKVGDTAIITLIHQETDSIDVSVNVSSSASKEGIQVTLTREDESNLFTGQFTLCEQVEGPSPDTLKVHGNGDLVKVKYTVSSTLELEESCRVFPSKDKYCHGLDGLENLLGECKYCTNEGMTDGPPKVLLAVIRKNQANEGYPEIDPDTWKYKKTVYNNALLYELLTYNNEILHDHISNKNNPHEVTAAQIGLEKLGITISSNEMIEIEKKGRKTGKESGKATYNITKKIYYRHDQKPLGQVPPYVTLGKIEDQTDEVQSIQGKIDYMEDLGFLKLHYLGEITGGSIADDPPPKWFEKFDNYFNSKDEPILFKAIDIDTSGFRILSIWPLKTESSNINIRWWASFPIDARQLSRLLAQM